MDRSVFTTLAALVFALTTVRSGVSQDWRTVLKTRLGPRRTSLLRCLVRGKRIPRWGNLRVTEPFSSEWGLDRGTPVDRRFTDWFFEENSPLITGNVLEIQNRVYAARFGQNVRRLDTVDIDAQFRPTIVCDLSQAETAIPSDEYDCFVLPYTLPFIPDLDGALRNAMRVVKPGGTVLATASVIAPVFAEYPEYWRMTEHGWRETLARVWPGAEVDVRTHGSCVSAMASVLGLAQEELKSHELEREDPRFPVLISIKGRKATA